MNMPGERTRHVMTDVENARELLDFPLSKQLGKLISHRDSQQGKEKNDNAIRKCFVLVCANMRICVLVPSFSIGSIWSGEIWPVPPFLFPPVVPRVSKPGTVNHCLFSAQVCVADPNSIAGKPVLLRANLTKKNNLSFFTSFPLSPHSKTAIEICSCMWADVYVSASELVSCTVVVL